MRPLYIKRTPVEPVHVSVYRLARTEFQFALELIVHGIDAHRTDITP